MAFTELDGSQVIRRWNRLNRLAAREKPPTIRVFDVDRPRHNRFTENWPPGDMRRESATIMKNTVTQAALLRHAAGVRI